jgi:hypothetical protein
MRVPASLSHGNYCLDPMVKHGYCYSGISPQCIDTHTSRCHPLMSCGVIFYGDAPRLDTHTGIDIKGGLKAPYAVLYLYV